MTFNELQQYDEGDDARQRSLEAYHRAREARAAAVRAGINFAREHPGTTLALGALAWWLLTRRR